jgi:3-methylfumaryl-CoA hydratase
MLRYHCIGNSEREQMVDSAHIQDLPLEHWIGRTESRTDLVTPAPIAALAATLDRDDPLPQPGDALPPLWHWLYFLPVHCQSELGPDGHAKRGGFLPPVPLPRRMWAGGRLEFHHAPRVGETITRVSRILDVKHKQGRTGALVFVLVRHEISNPQGVALTEEHDIVFRDFPRPGDPVPPPPAPGAATWHRTIHPDDVFLFRYSALTFNGHRIHYDRHYATEVEGYPGLVVHGPLIATLLLDLLRRSVPAAQVKRFEFRAVSPLFDIAPFIVCGKPERSRAIRLWAQNAANGLAMDARAITISG